MGSLSNTFVPDSSPVVSLYLYLGQGMIWHWFSCWIIIVASAMDNRESTAWVFLDLWKAFDTIDQHSLINKLDHYGIRGHSFNWVSSYLTDRKQLVQFTWACSQPDPIVCDIPQESIVGPLLFIIYINPFAPEPPVTAHADPRPFYPLWRHQF